MQRRVVRSVLLPLVFAISYSQSPLYTSNQHTYMLHGLAQGGFGHLDQDWLSSTADPVPLFSLLVRVTFEHSWEWLFHVYYLVILALYAHSLLGIVAHVFTTVRSTPLHLVCTLALAGLHSPVTGRLSEIVTGMNLSRLIQEGVAGQYILGSIFQPSVFGVLLLVSIHLVLEERMALAGLCAGLATAFHPTYLISGGLLLGSYLFIALRTGGSWRRAAACLVLFVVPATAIAAYSASTLGPVEPAQSEAAAAILAQERIPHHVDPAIWFDGSAVVKLIAVMAALVVVRSTRLLPILLISALGAVFFTAVQLATGSRILALLFPWRPSVYLVPVSFSLLAVWGLSRAWRRFEQSMPVGRLGKFLATSALLALAVSGVATFALRQRAREADPSRPLMEHVRSNGKRGDVWLVPLQFESFRLETGNPIVADTKSHPLRADEVIEWHDRVEAIRSLYGQEGSSLDCAVLEATAARYGANHVAVPADRRAECDALEPVYRDARFAAFAVRTLAPP